MKDLLSTAGCDRCLRTARFRFVRGGGALRCWRHAFAFGQLVRTAFFTALVVGSVLTLINQGDLLLRGEFRGAMAWKIPLTYCVPYSVVTFSGLRLAWIGGIRPGPTP